jgi:hypothetical protein
LLGSFLMHPVDIGWWMAAAAGSLGFVYLARRLSGLPAWSLGGEEGDHWISDETSLGTRLVQGALNLGLWLIAVYVLVKNFAPFGWSD